MVLMQSVWRICTLLHMKDMLAHLAKGCFCFFKKFSNAPFVIQEDASGVGAVLLQENPEGILQPSDLTDTGWRWAVAYAVWWALLTWWHFLEGSKLPFEAWTDHKNLEALTPLWKLSPKQAHWVQYFNYFNFTLHCIPGWKNILMDTLSHLSQYNSEAWNHLTSHPIKPISSSSNNERPGESQTGHPLRNTALP